jgi:PAS domain S-box-containing protein
VNDEPRATVGGPPRPGAGALALAYALFAALWILLSDMAMESWLEQPNRLVLASALKGWLFVLVTALLLYGVLRRHERRTAPPVAPPAAAGRPHPWLRLTGLALAIAAITAGIVFQIIRHEKENRAEQLQTVADLKSQQLAGWISERLADVRQLHIGKPIAQVYLRWRREADPEALAIVAERLAQIVDLDEFTHGVLLDEAGRTVWTNEAGGHELEPAALDRLLAAARAQGAGWLGPYRDSAGRIHLEFFATLAIPEAEMGPIVVLHADDDWYLPAGLNAWPLPSETGEVVLVRREGDRIVYLNALRHDPEATLNLHRPLDDRALLAAQLAVNPGLAGRLLEGRDYRGKAVIGAGRPVPGTDWYLLAKMDREEFYAEALARSLWVILAAVFALLTAGTTLYLARQRQELAVARAVQQAQAERLTALRLLGAIADASADAIFAKDLVGRYLLFNRAAGGFTGKSPEEVLGRDDTALFPPEQAAMIRANDRRVMEENRVVDYEEALDTALGPRTFLALKGPLRGDDGQVIGVYGISRDITERSAAEEDLRRSNEELQRFNRAMVGRELEMIRLKREINALARALGRPAPYEVPAPEPDGPGRPEASNPLPGGRP